MDNNNIRDVDLSEYEDAPEMPEECPESEEAIEEISHRSLDEKYTFINVIVLAVVLIGCAAYFITMTSSKRYGDEGNKFSLERLANGKYTAEVSKRYYSSIAYPDGIKSLADKITRFYGITEGKPDEEVLAPDEKKEDPSTEVTGTSDTRSGHDEKEVTTSGTDEAGEKEKKTKATSGTIEKYATKFYHTTTTEEETTTEDDSSEEETTTTNNTSPAVTSTTTEKSTKWTHKETSQVTKSETKPTSADSSKVTEDTSRQTAPPEDSSSEVPEDSPEDDASAEDAE